MSIYVSRLRRFAVRCWRALSTPRRMRVECPILVGRAPCRPPAERTEPTFIKLNGKELLFLPKEGAAGPHLAGPKRIMSAQKPHKR
jgi:hypothetical protein